MPELKDGLILTQSKALAGNFTHNGKPIELKQDENNPLLWSAQETLTEEEKQAGNQEFAFYLNFGEAEGTLRKVLSPSGLDKDPAFKDLNDAEKVTKLSSIKHQFGEEPTDIGKGLDEVLQTSVKVPKQNENFAETRKHAGESLREKQSEKNNNNKDESVPGTVVAQPQPTTSKKDKSSSESETVKSGDSIKVSK